MPDIVEVTILFIILIIFSFYSYKKKSLDREGVLLANAAGIGIFLLGNIETFLIILIFFLTGELATRIARNKKKKHEKRTIGNIVGNSGVAIISLALGNPMGFYGAMSGALADTLSSEIGLTSKTKPILITTFEEVEPGIDGGVTKKGIFASFIGALIISFFYFIFHNNIFIFAILIISGITGSLSDSLFGAIYERKGKLNNTMVNFIGSGTSAIMAVLLVQMINFFGI